MYNRLLDTFLAASDCGSFSRAAERLHISSTAIVKQINQLEDEMGVRLFSRTSRGVALTEAGKAFQEESRKIIRASEEATRRIQRIESRSIQQVRLGTSQLRPAPYFLHLWSKVYGKPLEHRVNIVPFLDNDFNHYMKVVASLGRDLDVIATAFPNELTGYHCNALAITKVPFCCAIPTGHRLAQKSMLEVSDLCGENLIILAPGLSSAVDEARAELEKYPDITLVDNQDYEPATFNRCEATNQLLLTLECWSFVHPMLKTLPINWSFGTTYGLLYSLAPSPETQQFIDFIRRTLKHGTG